MPVISKENTIPESLKKRRHSAAHIMAEVVQDMFPSARLAIGPAIDNGFYYDFDMDVTISQKELKAIEKAVKKRIRQQVAFERKTMTIAEARSYFGHRDEDYKLELIADLAARGEQEVSLYCHGTWCDLCAGPHVATSQEINAKGVKIDRVSGAYWRGDEKNKMLQRIYGLYFDTAEELKDYLAWREDAKKRDHRVLGKQLKLFMSSDVIGRGLPMLLPNGATIRRILERWVVDEELKRGYSHVYTPVLGKVELYKISGHWDHYRHSMYSPIEIEDEAYVLRPMTCPYHFIMYKNELRSYRDLPVKYAEISPLYRYEKSGELTGLIRVRNFTLADAHLICTPEQMKDEFKKVIDLVNHIMETLGIAGKAWYRASLRDDEEASEKYIDNPEMWAKGEALMLEILEEMNLPYVIAKGEAAFYGPKIDVQLTNVYGKEETAFTIQIDLVLADRFDLEYVDQQGRKQRPVIIHRSSIGCLERTIAFLTEFYGGKFPPWFAPVQVQIIPLGEDHHSYARTLEDTLREANFRVHVDRRNESLGKKIREARLQRIPYLAIIGDNEVAAGTLTVRNRDTGEQHTLDPADFIARLGREIGDKLLHCRI